MLGISPWEQGSDACGKDQLKPHKAPEARGSPSKQSWESSSGQVALPALSCSHGAPDQYQDISQVRDGAVRAAIHPRVEQQPVPSTSGRADVPTGPRGWRATASADLAVMISLQMQRERDLAPRGGYLPLGDAAAPGAAFVTPQMRAVVASWLSEVAAEFRMQQETLFLAVSLLDRFQEASPAGVPRNVLQLVAVACIMMASKQDEVAHPSVDDFTEIAADAFKRDDLLRMERVLLDQLEWRVSPPTAYTFLHLLTQALAGSLTPPAIATAAYLCELSLLDYGLLTRHPSAVAAAAVAIGAAWHARGAAPALERLTGHSRADLAACAAQLLHLHTCAAHADTAPAYQPMAFIRDKYSQSEWVGISRWHPSNDAMAALAASLGTSLSAGHQQPSPPPPLQQQQQYHCQQPQAHQQQPSYQQQPPYHHQQQQQQQQHYQCQQQMQHPQAFHQQQHYQQQQPQQQQQHQQQPQHQQVHVWA